MHLTQLIYMKLKDLVTSYGGTTRIIFASEGESNAPIARFLDTQEIKFFYMSAYIENRRLKATRFPINGYWNEYGNYLAGMGLFQIVTQVDVMPNLAD